MQIETVITMLILAVSVVVSFTKLRRAFAPAKQHSCNSGCSSCPLKKECNGNQ